MSDSREELLERVSAIRSRGIGSRTYMRPVGEGRIGCRVIAVFYDPPARSGSLHVAANEYTDMDACIALFTSIDPEIQTIVVDNSRDIKVVYTRLASYTWEALEVFAPTPADLIERLKREH